MPADKAQGRGRSGPRHAAPRKSLLTRLNIPAGKAVAAAAVPTAMLMGMGFTPQLAQAKPLPKNPFKGDACVSAPDKEETEAEQEERKERAEKLKRDLARERAKQQEKAEDEKGGKGGKGTGDAGGESGAGAKDPVPDPSGGAADKPAPEPTKPPSSGGGGGGGGGEDADKPAPEPSPSESEDSENSEGGENPWYDPLGVGKKIEDAFTPKDEEKPDEPEPGPSKPSEPSEPSDPAEKPDPAPEPEKPAPGDGAGETSPDPAPTQKPGEKGDGQDGQDGKDGEDTGKGDRAGAKDGEKAGKDKPGASEPGKNGEARDYDAAKDAGKPFPCATKGDFAGKAEQTPAQIPNQPWYLKASSLTLRGSSYKGIVDITMPNGKTKQALKYTADELDIGDMHQTVEGPAGKTTHVKAADGSTSTIRGGKVTMYTEELKGKLFGLIPMTFSPESPPPLDLPFIYLTDVEVRQSAQFGGNLTVPGLHTFLTD